MSESLASFLQQHADILTLLPSNRIKCSITGHEMKPDLATVKAHIEGKKFKKAAEWYNHDFSQYLPYIVEHKSSKKHLYCILTKMQLNKIPDEIKHHCEGKSFLKLKAEYDARQIKRAERLENQKKNAAKREEYIRKNSKAAGVSAEESSEDEVDFWVPPGFGKGKFDHEDGESDEDDDEDVDDDEEDEDMESGVDDDDDDDDDSLADLIGSDDEDDDKVATNEDDEDAFDFNDVYEASSKEVKKKSSKPVKSEQRGKVSAKRAEEKSRSGSKHDNNKKSVSNNKDSDKKRKRDDHKAPPSKLDKNGKKHKK